ncbi:hybrid sensor histidine kinase/response regulator [Desulfurivibrio alkaliphilus]|uniref:histidine kinase n=1 Tax=Desulfurivibrio alkaliphilus (strain DSM 19089 / UNIQEM U267 / AHT2) TaxID=589865 RepID=D6Z203_DESAT|nr:ATP-binding protein [Desulfurivibrio alkaliphilus]ADH85578.1 GAF sensor hybrid histidine kinase [Desulfurivibrio alkaliphilus AHT 2]
MQPLNNDELLREALLDLAKARELEERQRRKSEALLTGLRVLIKPADSARMFKELLAVLQEILNFEEAFVLARRPDGSLVPTVATSETMLAGRWLPQAMLQRVLAGRPVTVFDVGQIEEWRQQPAEILAKVSSALHVPLREGEQAAVLVCTHSRRSFFNRNHQRLAENFSTLASQALLNAERQQMEDQLFQARKMEALGILAGGIAHDFNNILTPILINAQMAKLEARDNPILEQSLQQIEQATERAGALIQQILDFNRQGKHEPQPIQLGPIIKEALKFLRSTVAPNIEMEYTKKVDHDMVAADPTQMLQVIMNLALNAAYAMRDSGGRLEIELNAGDRLPPVAAPDAEQQESWLKMVVRDHGPGINPEHLHRIFDPFFTTKGKGEGSGMGLAVVHGIVSNHGGTINCYSQPGQGATFEILLPEITGRQPATTGSSPPAEMTGGQETILLVDDELPVVQAFAPNLEKLGYRVDTTTNSEEALAMIRRSPKAYDLLITDYNMPRLNGLELARQVKQTVPQLPIILCTGFSGYLDDEQQAQDIATCISKPFSIGEIAAVIRNTLNQDGRQNDGPRAGNR